MTRRHRYAVALVCLAALAVALALPDLALAPFGLGEPAATIAAPPAAAGQVGSRAHRPSPFAARASLAPRAPPTA
jgi:hypothetical protein